jgi:hypothetical protein
MIVQVEKKIKNNDYDLVLCAKMPKMMVFVELLEAVKNKPNSKL